MKSKIEIGTRVNGSNGEGMITRIITKSTGYVEVTYDNGKVKKEMAFNLTDTDLVSLKNKPIHKQMTIEQQRTQHYFYELNLKRCLEEEIGRTGLTLEQLKSIR